MRATPSVTYGVLFDVQDVADFLLCCARMLEERAHELARGNRPAVHKGVCQPKIQVHFPVKRGPRASDRQGGTFALQAVEFFARMDKGRAVALRNRLAHVGTFANTNSHAYVNRTYFLLRITRFGTLDKRFDR